MLMDLLRQEEEYHHRFIQKLPALPREERKNNPEGTGRRSRIVVRKGDLFIPLSLCKIAFIFCQGEQTFVLDFDRNRYLVDQTIKDLEELDIRRFFRVNRDLIVNIEAVAAFRPLDSGALSLRLRPEGLWKEVITLGPEKARAFKNWIQTA